jgi:hypothetical protein
MEIHRKIFYVFVILFSVSGLFLLVLSNYIYVNPNLRLILSGLMTMFLGLGLLVTPEKNGVKDIKLSNKSIGIFAALIGIFITVDSVIRFIR